jgi:uncharacterized protein (TIGR01440 family)
MKQITENVLQALLDLNEAKPLSKDHVLVIGTSTSEVIGEKIGTSGSVGASESLFSAFHEFHKRTGVQLAFQCCEHLNRALVVERTTALQQRSEVVSVIPVKEAGGQMATYAYGQLEDPVVIEFIDADAGIDIGDTFIGMHLKHVAIPIRSKIKQIGQAHLTLAASRPKLIGGARAVYQSKDNTNQTCT